MSVSLLTLGKLQSLVKEIFVQYLACFGAFFGGVVVLDM